MEKHWPIFSQILTFLFLVFGLCGISTAEERPNAVPFFNRYFDCIPVITHNRVPIDTTRLSNNYRHADNISLQFVAFGNPLTVDLSLNKRIFPHSYVERVFFLNGSGAGVSSTDKQTPENCYYHGIVRGQPRSEAAISTCNGISGYITDRRDTYHIEPWRGKVHRVYRNSDQKRLPFKCGTVGHDHRMHEHQEVIKRYKRSVQAPYDSNRNTRYVELYLVNDYRTYERHGKNKTIVIKRSQDIANIVSSLYRQLNIYVALVGVEVWGAGDLIKISKSADNTMENFLRYRKERINPVHHNDNSQLITGKYFDHGVVGKAIKGPICTHQYSGGVNMDYGGLVTLVATTVAHEMGHNFGMEHDNDTMCECRDEKCIMAATSGQISPRHWSSCSQNALAEAFDLGMDYCLRNLPTMLFEGPVCGNGIKEDGEECDCGLPQDCTNRCCNPNTCRMYPRAQCATGMCCDLVQCKPKQASTMCREPNGECDLPEYCDGISEYCPKDYFVQDGVVCQKGESYCYRGECNTHTRQCKLLWGETGRVSDPICFQQLNMNGDGEGSCAYNWTTNRYTRCDKEDVLCGLLHCVHLNEKLMFWKDNLALVMGASFLSRGNNLYVCRSAMLDVGLDMRDPGLVPDGAKCEKNKICINQKCVPLAKLPVEPCPDGCHGHGRCNSNNTCHCDIGYAPPLCDRPGFGGSTSSGPASNTYAKKKNLLVALLVVLVVLILMVLAILAYCNRGYLQKWLNRVPDLKYRVKEKSKKSRPHSLLDSNTGGASNRDSTHSNTPPPGPTPTAWNPVVKKEKVPPQRPMVAPKRVMATAPPADKEQFSNHNVSFCSSQPDVGAAGLNPLPSNNIPHSPKSSAKAIVKRESSLRGSKISEPVLMSTTNRNSVVLADMQVSIIGPEADRDPNTNSPSPRQKTNTSPVKRSLSDRRGDRPDGLSQHPVTHLGTLNLQTSAIKPESHAPVTVTSSCSDFQPTSPPSSCNKPPADAEDEKELIYSNDMDMGDLLQDIERKLKGDDSNVYYNLSNNSSNPHQSAVLEVNGPPELPSRASKPTLSNGLGKKDASHLAAKPKAATRTAAISNHTSKPTTATSIKNGGVSGASSRKSAINNKVAAPTRSSAIEELKNSLQKKSESPVSPKRFSSNSPLLAEHSNNANKVTSNRTTFPSNITNVPSTPISKTHNKDKNNTTPTSASQQKPVGGEKVPKPSSFAAKPSSVVAELKNKNSNVSNLTSRFGPVVNDTDKKLSSSGASRPLLRHNQTVSGDVSRRNPTGDVPSKTDKPGISAKPLPPPKPVQHGDRSPTTASRPAAASIKRVHSYRI